MLTLYYAPGACSLAPHICLEEAGAQAQYVRVDLGKGEHQTADFLALNPNARVPLLVTEKGRLSEASAIMEYIALTWPQAKLMPVGDPWAIAQVQSFNSYLSTSLHASSFASVFRPGRFSDDVDLHGAIKAKGLATLKDQLGLIESRLEPGKWVHGAYTTSDPYLFVMARWWVRLGQALEAFPNIAGHAERMLKRPAVKRAFEAEGIVFG